MPSAATPETVAKRCSSWRAYLAKSGAPAARTPEAQAALVDAMSALTALAQALRQAPAPTADPWTRVDLSDGETWA